MSVLYLTAMLYLAGTVVVLASLLNRSERLQSISLGLMVAGWLAHTVWIGSICVKTGHPPLTNLPEIASFLGWTIFAVELFLFIRYRVQAAAFFVYPLVLMLITVTMIVHEPFLAIDPSQKSAVFIFHLFFTTVGMASLLVGLAFLVLFHIQQRSLKKKSRGPLFEWIPSLQVCEQVSYRALSIGFGVYTLGLLAGILWSYRTTSALINFRAKELGAVISWVFFAMLVQSYFSGSYRTPKNLLLSIAAFVSIVVAIFGIRHV